VTEAYKQTENDTSDARSNTSESHTGDPVRIAIAITHVFFPLINSEAMRTTLLTKSGAFMERLACDYPDLILGLDNIVPLAICLRVLYFE